MGKFVQGTVVVKRRWAERSGSSREPPHRRQRNDIEENMTLPETASSRWEALEGLPFPLGPTRIEEEAAYNFALYSKHAERVTLLLYTESDIVNPVFEYQFDYRLTL